MDSRKPLDPQAVGLMIAFCLCLGLQQVVIKATAGDISPVLQLALRSGIAAVLVLLYMGWSRERLALADGNWKPGLVVGGLFALEYLFLGEALRFTSASHAVVFLYTSPVFTALALHFLVVSERLSALQWTGILLALGGIALAFLGPGGEQGSLFGDLLALLAGAAWGATTVVIRTSRLALVSARQTLLYQLVTAFVLLLASAVALDQLHFSPTPRALAGLAFQSVVVCFAAFLIWFWLLRHYLASRVVVLSFMTPLFGVALGAWLLREPLEPEFLAGAWMVIAGVVLVSGEGWFKALLARVAGRAAR
ncbi:DMT family transporter [Zobellella sp. DQSA1]|uniref:DMT family transporter n=1 Tax=Zobellella sp. DQSA1 TaxID=3342386 RepID=UPI0035BFAB26